jgi:hypothetical protein
MTRTMNHSAAAGLGVAVSLGVHLGWIRPRVFRCGATGSGFDARLM